MNDDNKFWLIIWFMVLSTLLIISTFVWDADRRYAPMNTQVRVECIKHGGTWGPMPGSDTDRTCIMK